ncbi:MAG TPA: PIN domain-containing protein [Candidatus Paceibacterota bacterium]|nr:PIN domain-containing protein [Candidatus Paceibacterota bacterium]
MGYLKYFFDSYAVIEIVTGNPNYAKFVNEVPIITIFNLAEIYYSSLNRLDDKRADEIYEKYCQCVVEVSDEILKKAIKFRKENKKKDLSYADCIGYICALENNMKFLTGDKEFEGMRNVEFVK